MTTRLMVYGSEVHAQALAKVGKKRTPINLASRMPSAEIAAKVGSAQCVPVFGTEGRTRRIVRRKTES